MRILGVTDLILSYFSFACASKTRECGALYLTVSAVESLLTINWHFTCTNPPDLLVLCKEDPETTGCSKPLTTVSATNRTKGIVYTSMKLEPNISFPGGWNENDTNPQQGSHCFPYWVASVRNGSIVDSNCLKIEPTWMEKFGSLRIHSLMIPGTHNSGSWQWSFSIYFIDKYLLNQNRNLWTQLVAGIRFFDIRIGYYKSFWINHSVFKITQLEPELRHVATFLKKSPKEVIILNFHLFYFPEKFLKEYHAALLKLLQDLFEKHILPPSFFPNGTNPTLKQIWDTNKRLIIGYNDTSQIKENDWLWRPPYRKWGNEQSFSDLYNYISKEQTNHNHTDTPMCVIMAEETPSLLYIATHLFGSLKKIADSDNPRLDQAMREGNWSKNFNIVAIDFFMSSDVVDIAIEVNQIKLEALNKVSSKVRHS